MSTELTEEEMRQALFGSAQPPALTVPHVQDDIPEVVIFPRLAAPKRIAAKPITPRMRVTLRVGNEFEGKTESFNYDADTLSTLLAEQEATKAARKKFKYVEVVSVKSMQTR